jgi:DNA-binding FadR family transcriptional regulator
VLGPLPARPTAVRAARAALERAILAGTIAAGERLPPERELSTELGVNRTTLRAALRELETVGLVSVRHGSGYAVRDYRKDGGPDLLAPLYALAKDGGAVGPLAADMLFVRRHLAVAVLDALARRAPPAAALAAIDRAIDAFEAAASGPAPTAAQLAARDLDVIHAIVTASGNVVLPLFLNPISKVLAELPELAAALYADPLENVAAFRLVAAALRRDRGGLDGETRAAILSAMEARDADTLSRLGVGAPRAVTRAPRPAKEPRPKRKPAAT